MTDEANIDTKPLPPVKGIELGVSKSWRDEFLIATFLAMIAFALYATPAFMGRPICDTPEARIAVAAREMILTDNYLVPANGGEARLKKPPLPYWVAAYTARVMAPESASEGDVQGRKTAPAQYVMARAVQLPAALAVALTVFLATFYAAYVFSQSSGLLTGFLLGCSVMVTTYSFLGNGDSLLMFTTTLGLCGAAWIVTATQPGILSAVVFGCGLGLAILTKGHIPILIILAPVVAEVFIRRRINGRKIGIFIFGLLIAAGIALPWFIKVEQVHPGSFNDLMNEVGDAVNPNSGHTQSRRYSFYFEKLAGGLMPWTPLLLIGWILWLTIGRKIHAIADHLVATDTSNPQRAAESQSASKLSSANLRFMLLAGILGFIGFYSIPKQQEYYLLPILPPLFMASGGILGRFNLPGGRAEEALAKFYLGFGILVALGIATLPVWLPEIAARQSVETRESMLSFSDAVGWGVTIPGSIAVLLLHFALARQWVEGRIVTATLIYGTAAYVGLFAWAFHWTNKVNAQTTLNKEAPHLRKEIEGYGKDGEKVRVYAAGTATAKLVFYLNRPVYEFKSIASERILKPENSYPLQPQRLLVISHDDFKKLDSSLMQKLVPNPSGEPRTRDYAVIPLSADENWIEVIRAARFAKER